MVECTVARILHYNIFAEYFTHCQQIFFIISDLQLHLSLFTTTIPRERNEKYNVLHLLKNGKSNRLVCFTIYIVQVLYRWHPYSDIAERCASVNRPCVQASCFMHTFSLYRLEFWIKLTILTLMKKLEYYLKKAKVQVQLSWFEKNIFMRGLSSCRPVLSHVVG